MSYILPICIRGSNENLKGLIRQYIQKYRPFSILSDKKLARIDSLLNNRLKKRL
jgi:IS30 family transposase